MPGASSIATSGSTRDQQGATLRLVWPFAAISCLMQSLRALGRKWRRSPQCLVLNNHEEPRPLSRIDTRQIS